MAGNLDSLLDNNKAWAQRVSEEDPEFFARLAKQQQGVFVAVPLSRWETTSAHFGARLEPRIQNMRFKLAYLQP